MAANYWNSTQAQYWTFSRASLAETRTGLQQANQQLYTKHSLPDIRHLSIYIQSQLIKISRRLMLRQQALATAQVYIKRFYLRVPFAKTNPYLIMATAVYLACKMEEYPQHIRLVLGEAVRQWPELAITETSKIGECEFALISTLESRLIVHHPYRALSELQGIFGLTPEECTLASTIINDSYNTDLPLLYAPHIIAITAIFLAVVLRPVGQPAGLQAHSAIASVSGAAAQSAMGGLPNLKQAGPKLGRLMDWLAESKVDMEAIVDATQEMVSLYECWEGYNERGCKETITRFMRDGK